MKVIFFILVFFLSFYLINAVSKAKFENHYETLGVKEDASERTIKKKYRELAKQYHPDKTASKKSSGKVNDEAVFAKITNAYSVLSDEKLRAEYDQKFQDWKDGIFDPDDEDFYFEEFESKLTVYHVLLIGSVVFTALQYYYFHRSFNAAYKDAYESDFYQNKLEQFELKKKELIRKGATDEANFLQPPKVYVEDKKKPHWKDLYLVQLFFLPLTIYNWNLRRLKIKEDAIKEAEKIKDWKILSSQQKKDYLARQEEKLRRREQKREEEELRRSREKEEEQEKIQRKQKEAQLLQEHENKLKKLREELRQLCEKSKVDQEKIEFLCIYLKTEKLNTLIPLLKNNNKEGLKVLEKTYEEMKTEIDKYQSESSKKKRKSVAREESTKEWTNEELKLLTQSVVKYPIGTQERLKKIAFFMKTNRSESEIANMMKKMNENKIDTSEFQRIENRSTKKGFVDTGPKEVPYLDEEEKNGSSNNSHKNGNSKVINNTNNEKKTSESSTSVGKSVWTSEEQNLLETALKKYNNKEPNRWELISKMVTTKTENQCKERYKFIVEQIKNQKTKNN